MLGKPGPRGRWGPSRGSADSFRGIHFQILSSEVCLPTLRGQQPHPPDEVSLTLMEDRPGCQLMGHPTEQYDKMPRG